MTRRKMKNRQQIPAASRSDRNDRITRLIQSGWIGDAAEIPADAIPVDPDKVIPGSAWSPVTFYQDQPFRCRDCGVSGVWKADDQRWYFETVRVPHNRSATRCLPCRRIHNEHKARSRRLQPPS